MGKKTRSTDLVETRLGGFESKGGGCLSSG